MIFTIYQLNNYFILKMRVKITFFYERKTIEIQCTDKEIISDIFKRFLYKLNQNLKLCDFDFFYEGEKLNLDSTIENNEILKNKYQFSISAERKTRIIKCPECICNDSIINIGDNQITFYGCKYGHIINKLYSEYKQSQKIDFCRIVCSKSGCGKNQRDDPQDFYKCLTCTKKFHDTKYFCNKCYLAHDKSHTKIKYDEKNYFCEKYFNQFLQYCFTCKKNLCKNCVDEHKTHETISYDSISLNIEDIKKNIATIKGKIEELGITIDDIKQKLDGAKKIYENYCEIVDDIIEKYELFNQNYKNYRVIKSIFNINQSNIKISKDLDKINDGINLKEKISNLIDLYLEERNNYKRGHSTIIGNYDDDEDLKEWIKAQNKSKEKSEEKSEENNSNVECKRGKIRKTGQK